MALGSRGPRGYGDWQRIVNWDGPTLYESTALQHEGRFMPIARMAADRYSHLSGLLSVGENPVLVTLGWWTAQTEAKALCLRQFVLDPKVPESAFLHIPNMGPWLEVEMTPASEVTRWKLSTALAYSNRVFPLELVPRYPALLDVTHEFAGAGAFTVYPSGYYAGPIRLLLSQSAALTANAKLEVAKEPGVWVVIDVASIAAAETKGFTMLAPSGAWRVTLEASGIDTVICRVVPSVTGSS